MENEIQREQISKTSPLKKAKYAVAFVTAAAVMTPFAFGINTFSWVASWFVGNWPRLIIIAALAAYFGKSHFSG